MRIAYFLHPNMGARTGVYRKVVSQARAWLQAGHDVRIFLVTREESVARALDGDLPGRLTSDLYGAGRIATLRSRLRALSRACQSIEIWVPDVVYTRQDFYYPAVARLSKLLPLVIEVNSNDVVEIDGQSKLQGWVHRLTRGRILRKAAGLVFVSRELSKLSQFSRYSRPSIVVANGYDLSASESYSGHEKNASPRLVFIGHRGMPWHGTDKILDLALQFPQWKFDLVGISGEDLSSPPPANVTLHGELSANEYGPVLRSSDCALGSLAMHRAGINEASPLKTREYLAYGLPTVIGYLDTDFPDGADFILRLPNNEENVRRHSEQVSEFVERWRGRRVGRELIRHLDVGEKERARVEFFKSVAEARK